MNKKLLLIVLLTFIFISSSKAQTFQKTDFGIKLKINSVEIEIQFYDTSIVRILKSPEGTIFKKKASVIKNPQKI